MKYSSQFQHFSDARSSLLLPCLAGESEAYRSAIIECGHALCDLDLSLVHEPEVVRQIEELKTLIDVSGLTSDPQKGTSFTKAESLSFEEKERISKLIDDLASWFTMEMWSS